MREECWIDKGGDVCQQIPIERQHLNRIGAITVAYLSALIPGETGLGIGMNGLQLPAINCVAGEDCRRDEGADGASPLIPRRQRRHQEAGILFEKRD